MFMAHNLAPYQYVGRIAEGVRNIGLVDISC